MQVLEPIYKATLICEGLKQHTISMSQILSSKLIFNFIKLSSSSNLTVKHLSSIIYESLNYHLDSKITIEQKNSSLVLYLLAI